MIEKLHQKFIHLTRISSALVMRHTRLGWDECDEIVKQINALRDAQGINRKKWERIK